MFFGQHEMIFLKTIFSHNTNCTDNTTVLQLGRFYLVSYKLAKVILRTQDAHLSFSARVIYLVHRHHVSRNQNIETQLFPTRTARIKIVFKNGNNTRSRPKPDLATMTTSCGLLDSCHHQTISVSVNFSRRLTFI